MLQIKTLDVTLAGRNRLVGGGGGVCSRVSDSDLSCHVSTLRSRHIVCVMAAQDRLVMSQIADETLAFRADLEAAVSWFTLRDS